MIPAIAVVVLAVARNARQRTTWHGLCVLFCDVFSMTNTPFLYFLYAQNIINGKKNVISKRGEQGEKGKEKL